MKMSRLGFVAVVFAVEGSVVVVVAVGVASVDETAPWTSD